MQMQLNYGEVSIKTVAVAITVFALLQVVKKFTNWSFAHGKWAVVVNIVFSIVGQVATTPPNQLFTSLTLINLLTICFLASGFHGVATAVAPSLSVPNPVPANPPVPPTPPPA